jgi:S-adenosylmethionine decarboxylase
MTDGIAPGKHLLIDFWHTRRLTSDGIETAMRQAAAACGATVLHVLLHEFGDSGGLTGVAILAESHISIHTWPELDYVALDVFVCGACDAGLALDVLKDAFAPGRAEIVEALRGRPAEAIKDNRLPEGRRAG